MTRMGELADEMRKVLSDTGDLDEFARLLHEGWLLKRSLGFGISNTGVDKWYEAARKAGATGGKLLGAGGGGFLLLIAHPEKHDAIRQALGNPREIAFRIDRRGSRIIFISDRYSF
jgi:D-glycero-alpha-D-manno-heptose-7-phosphate kinase